MEISDSEALRDHFPEEDLPGFNFRKLTGKIVDNWYWFLISLCISLVVAWCITGYYPPLYAVKGSILINDHRNSFLTDNTGFSGQALQGFSTNHRGFYNQMILLKSKPVIAKVIQDLGLEISYYDEKKFRNREIYKDAPFRVIWDKACPQWVGLDFRLTIGPARNLRLEAEGKNTATYDYSKAIWTSRQQAISIDRVITPGEPVILPGGCCFTIIQAHESGFSGTGRYHFMFHSMQEMIGSYRSKLSIELPDHETSVIDLVLKDYHEQKGMDFINQLVVVYQMDDVERKNQFADRTIRFIDQLLLGVRDSLEIAGRELLSFRASTQIVDISAQSDQLLEQLGELDSQNAELEIRAEYLKGLKGYIVENRELSSLLVPASSSFSDPILVGLISDYNRLTREKTKMNRIKSAPRLNQLITELTNIREAMVQNIDNIIAHNNLSISQLKSKALALAGHVKHLPATERDLVNIERKYNLNNTTYNFLLGKLSEAQIAKASNQPESQIVEAAESLGMVAPRKGRVYEIGILAGLAFPFLIIFFHVLQNSKIVSKEDVEAITKYPVLGMIFFYKSAQKTLTPLLDNPNSPVNEPYRSLRYKLDLMVKGKSKPVIAVTSTSPGEGKTFTAVNIASTYALTRKKTVMVDLDLRNSKISETFGLDPDNGVVSYIMGQKSLDEIIVRVQHTNFHIIPAGPIPPNPGEMLMDDKIAGLMYELKSQFDVVIIDSAPVGYVADLFQITDQVDSLVFVDRDNFTQRLTAKTGLEEMKAFRLKGVGIVINAVKQGKSRYQRYGYGYGYGYGKH